MISIVPLRLIVRAPYASRASETGAIGVDFPLARDASGRVMIPNSLVIGKMADAMRELRDLLRGDPLEDEFKRDLAELFADDGKERSEEHDEVSDGRDARRNLTASDFVLQTEERPTGMRTRIAIENATMTVQDGMLQVIEQPFAAGTELAFDGRLRVFGEISDARKARLRKALAFVTQVGALRSVGFGEIVRLEDGTAIDAEKRELPEAPSNKVVLRLSFEDVFCAGEARNTPNTFSSADHVPGGVIKGAIARQMLAAKARSGFLDEAPEDLFDGDVGALAQSFSAVRVRHAQPVPRTQMHRPYRYLPDSLAAIDGPDGQPCIVDLAGLVDPSTAVLIDGQVPLAPFDWKQKHLDAALALMGVGEGPSRVLRIRTQISEDNRAAMTSRLFGVEYTRGDQHDFLAEVDLSSCPDPEATLRGLEEVLTNGLGGIGRGGAYAKASLEPGCAAERPQVGQRVVAVLQSPALLRDPSDPSTGLLSAYANAFAELGLTESWRLISVFARERLAGGTFFRNRLEGAGGRYAPWLLTEPGATFVFECEDAQTFWPAEIFARGLQVPMTVKLHNGIESVPKLYRVCPYLPENGYGDLVVDPFCIGGVPVWQVRSPTSLGLAVEPVGDFGPDRGGEG